LAPLAADGDAADANITTRRTPNRGVGVATGGGAVLQCCTLHAAVHVGRVARRLPKPTYRQSAR
jgi:hypothetical protein